MGICLEVMFAWGDGTEYKKDKYTASVFASIDLDKDLSDLYDHGIFELDHEYRELDNIYFHKHIKESPYGDRLRLMPAQKLLEFIESKKAILCQETEYMDHNGGGKLMAYFEPRVQALLRMLESLKGHSVILYWT